MECVIILEKRRITNLYECTNYENENNEIRPSTRPEKRSAQGDKIKKKMKGG